ncbi:MAG TPA: enoyl-CoA hydratase-related protein [Polyangiaceae bacterium]|nr:enoyl-CoA hydratase-related protein [Polyangiaceae bacterium]
MSEGRADARLERRGTVALVTLDRPERMNALSRGLVARFGDIGREVAAQSDVRLVIVTGAGDKAFCAGADLKERATLSHDEVRALLLAYESELGWLQTIAVPTLAAINGAALGGGLELALLCDLRIAAPHAVLGLPETSLGVIPGAGGTQRLPRLLGEARAAELILRAARLTAPEALILGLVNQVLPKSDDFVRDVIDWADPILSGAPLAIRAAVQAIRGATTRDLREGLALERAAYERCLQSEDRVEALAAFAEKRKPVFHGR